MSIELRRGQHVHIHHRSGTVHYHYRIGKVYKNGRFEIRGKVGTWYIEVDNLARRWNAPDYLTPMVAEIIVG